MTGLEVMCNGSGWFVGTRNIDGVMVLPPVSRYFLTKAEAVVALDGLLDEQRKP